MKKGHQILAALFVPEAIARLRRYFNEDQFFLRRLAATRPATRPLRPSPNCPSQSYPNPSYPR